MAQGSCLARKKHFAGLWLSQGLAWRRRALSGRAEEPLGPYYFLYGPRLFLLAYSLIFLRFVGLIPIGIFSYFLWPSYGLYLGGWSHYYPLSLGPYPKA